MNKNNMISALLAVLLIICGLAAKKFSPPPPPPATMIVAVDTTIKSKRAQDQATRTLSAMAEEMSSHDKLVVLGVDRKTTLEFEGPPPNASDMTALCRRLYAKPLPTTNLSNALERIVLQVEGNSGTPVCLIVISDGEGDGQPMEVNQRSIVAAKKMAQCSRVKRVALLGLERDGRNGWIDFATLLAPLGNKLTVQNSISLDAIEQAYRATRGSK